MTDTNTNDNTLPTLRGFLHSLGLMYGGISLTPKRKLFKVFTQEPSASAVTAVESYLATADTNLIDIDYEGDVTCFKIAFHRKSSSDYTYRDKDGNVHQYKKNGFMMIETVADTEESVAQDISRMKQQRNVLNSGISF